MYSSIASKKTLVLGATTNPTRFAYLATVRLLSNGVPVVQIGKDDGEVKGNKILQGKPELEDIHTVTLYLNPRNQEDFIDYIINLNPERIIYNPGTENPKLWDLAEARGIENVSGCTLVMLSAGQY